MYEPRSKEQKQFIDYLFKLLKTRKVVFIKEVYSDPKTPKAIRNYMLSGSITAKLSHIYAFNKGLICTTINFIGAGGISTIVFLRENEADVMQLYAEHLKLTKEYWETLDKGKELKDKMQKMLLKYAGGKNDKDNNFKGRLFRRGKPKKV